MLAKGFESTNTQHFGMQIRQNQHERRLRRTPREILRAILMLDDSPHSIALGTAVGMFIAMTPTVGIQMVLVVAVSLLTRRLFQFNRIAALLTVYVSNPFTVVPIYWFNYCVGAFFVDANVTYADFEAALHYEGLAEWWATVETLLFEVGTPLLLGSLVVATVTGLPTYPAMKWLVLHVRRDKTAKDSAQSTGSAVATSESVDTQVMSTGSETDPTGVSP